MEKLKLSDFPEFVNKTTKPTLATHIYIFLFMASMLGLIFWGAHFIKNYQGNCQCWLVLLAITIFLITYSLSAIYIFRVWILARKEILLAGIKHKEYFMGLDNEADYREHRRKVEEIQSGTKTDEYAWEALFKIITKIDGIENSTSENEKIEISTSTIKDLLQISEKLIAMIKKTKPDNEK